MNDSLGTTGLILNEPLLWEKGKQGRRGFSLPKRDVEPCPFAPYSDTNLRDSSLIEALQSDFLKEIRDNHDHLSETEGGCALWVERKWVQSVFQETKTRIS